MKHLIIGTAGHVDHGKTALVKAMTGVDTDRLKEEKERGISIELGFTYLNLPGGRRAGIVDVPGHERFIKNMLAGAGGFDLVLLVIAADEGVMPQTREHMDIIQLLQVNKGIVVLTKCDLVDDEWLDLVKEDVSDFLQETVLADAPVVTVSAVTKKGISELLELIGQAMEEFVPKAGQGRPRLPVDRVFTITGFGTVVTGTLLSGVIKVGEMVEVQPEGLSARVRTIQVHGEKVEVAEAGRRVAVNLAGLEAEQIGRGSVVAGPGVLKPSQRLDVRLLLLKSAVKPLKNRARVRFYLGTRETLGRVVLLDREELEPGSTVYAQIILEEQTVPAKGDRFVIRSYSPMRTIGGGTVIDPAPKRKHKRFREDVLDALATREKGDPAEIVKLYLDANSNMHLPAEVAAGTGLQEKEVMEAAAVLAEEKEVKQISGDGKQYFVSTAVYTSWLEDIKALVISYHRQFPLRDGYPKEEIRSRKFQQLSAKVFQLVLLEMEKEEVLQVLPKVVAVHDFAPGPDQQQKKQIQQIGRIMSESAFLPPSWAELSNTIGLGEAKGAELLQYLVRTGEMVKVTDDLYFKREVLLEAISKVAAYLSEHGEITVGELRDLLKTSRKYALPLLEYFDREKLTKRVGDTRLPGKALDNR
ncbi:MAG: selenocysteine-specific translation elongation factor [Desulfotomaculaceae bacterium]|nr:selenocysteine-specific translation elongation factor [Desulfotomaculaceae bacterium]MDD4766637.1 selenocysteine-specific translation elongation factor [Desulfotomaculaceae bacterium]